MNLSRTIVLLLAAVAAASPGAAFSQEGPPPVRFNEPAWEEFSSEEGRYSVLFPRKPGSAAGTVPSPYGLLTLRGTHAQMPSRLIEGVSYPDPYSIPIILVGAGWIDLPPRTVATAGVQAVLDWRMFAFLKVGPGELAERGDVSVEGHPGRHVKIRRAWGIGRYWTYVVGDRVYELVALTCEDVPEHNRRFQEEVVAKFHDSFKLTARRPALRGKL